MSQEAFDRGDWPAVIDAHRMKSRDASEWLRCGSALLHTLQPGPDVGKQQQQAALAFVQAQREGASAGAVAAAQAPQPPLLLVCSASRGISLPSSWMTAMTTTQRGAGGRGSFGRFSTPCWRVPRAAGKPRCCRSGTRCWRNAPSRLAWCWW